MLMYNLIEYSSNYSETTRSLWSYSKDEATSFDVDIANDNIFKSFKHKAKLLRNAVADGAHKILRNANIAVPLKYLSNFWRCLKMPICFSAAGDDNENSNLNNIFYTIKYTNLYVPVVTLSARDNQKLSKLLSKGFERSVYWNEYKTESENKNAEM